MKQIIAGAVAVLMAFGSAAAVLPEDVRSSLSVISAEAAAPQINATEATIYGMSSDYDGEITIAGNTSFRIKVSGASNVSYYVESGSSYASVDNDGNVTVSYTTWYWKNGFGTTAKPEDMTGVRVERSMYEGDAVISVNADGTVFKVTVHVRDYSEEYASKVMDDYIKENVTDGMSDEDKIRAAAKMAASYDYSVYYQSYQDMIIHGGGDCWASTNLIVEFCKRLGFNAWIHYIPNASHRNAYVEGSDGQVYEAEAGFGGTAPRSYYVSKVESLYTYSTNGDGTIDLIAYDGESLPEEYEIPSEVNGKTVTGIGEQFLWGESTIKKVVIPNTVKRIGLAAFGNMSALEEILFPSSVENIEGRQFFYDDNLRSVGFAEGSPYEIQNDLIYNTKTKTVVDATYAKTFDPPAGTKEYAVSCYRMNGGFKAIFLGSEVERIDDFAFSYCPDLRYVKISGSPVIGEGVFANYSGTKLRVVIPDTVREIGPNILHGMGDSAVIYTSRGSAADDYAAENGIKVRYFDELISGDVNDDKTINMKDYAELQKYLSGWDTEADEYMADVNRDDAITMKDYSLLQQYLAGWNVELK